MKWLVIFMLGFKDVPLEETKSIEPSTSTYKLLMVGNSCADDAIGYGISANLLEMMRLQV